MPYIGQTPTKVPLTSADIADGSIALADMAANSVDSDQYVDGSIDAAHLSANSVDSDSYVDGSIDTAHIATNQIDETLLKDALVGDFSDVTVTAADTFLYGDATDSGNTKKDTVQGILDLTGGSLSSTAVLAILSGTQANVTGDGTNYTATGAIWTEIADKGSDFVNGTFTAPSTGTYLIGYAAGISGQNTDTLNYHKMVTSNRTHQYEHGDYSGIDSTNAQMVFGNMMLADFDSGDTCTFQIDHNNGAKGVDLTTGSGNDTKLFFLLVA